jgi:hypothetical protein
MSAPLHNPVSPFGVFQNLSFLEPAVLREYLPFSLCLSRLRLPVAARAPMLAFADMFNLLVNELSGGRRRRLSFTQIFFRLLCRFPLRHIFSPSI